MNMRAPFLSEQLARFITDTRFDDLPPDVVAKASRQGYRNLAHPIARLLHRRIEET